jgi:hypothetical protein
MNLPSPQCRHLISLAHPVMSDLSDAHRALEPSPGCPSEWRARFNPGTPPSHDPGVYPPMASLRDAFHAVYTDLAESAPGVTAGLDGPNPFVPARGAFPTAGDFLAYLMTGHLAYHLGQLVAWRGAAGVGRGGGFDTVAA